MSEHRDLMKQCEAELERIGVAQRGGKKYMMVKDRMTFFRQAYGLEYGVVTELLHSDERSVCVLARVTGPDGRVVGSGLAEEQRGAGVNKASALENCESSAIGRALASLGLHGGEYPTLDEIESDRRSANVIDERGKNSPKPAPPKASVSSGTSDEKEDWPGWVKEQIAGMEKHRDLAEHQTWVDVNFEDLGILEKADHALWSELLAVYKERKSQMQNKEMKK